MLRGTEPAQVIARMNAIRAERYRLLRTAEPEEDTRTTLRASD
jgi:hypothetical protein